MSKEVLLLINYVASNRDVLERLEVVFEGGEESNCWDSFSQKLEEMQRELGNLPFVNKKTGEEVDFERKKIN
ncbi:hypothetical protein AN958_00057 [Leucoagaricus sp. SymC.cos]|nr:hypothetical protein AN958_00057 [Leucoagaricus sp. SymC.cos]